MGSQSLNELLVCFFKLLTRYTQGCKGVVNIISLMNFHKHDASCFKFVPQNRIHPKRERYIKIKEINLVSVEVKIRGATNDQYCLKTDLGTYPKR